MKLRVPEDVVWRDLGEEVVILNLATGIYFSLNKVGRRIWSLIAEQAGSDEVVSKVAQEFEADTSRIQDDFDSLVRELEAEGLVAAYERDSSV